MWWESTSSADLAVREVIARLIGRVRENVDVLPFIPSQFVYGIGSIRLGPAGRRPLLVVDSRLDFGRRSPYYLMESHFGRPLLPYEWRDSLYLREMAFWYRRMGLKRRFWRWLSYPGWTVFWNWHAAQIVYSDFSVPVSRLDSRSQPKVEPDLADCVLIFTSRPVPLWGRGTAISSGNRVGTIGLRVHISGPNTVDADGFTTAGHAVAGVAIQTKRLLPALLMRPATAHPVLLCETPSADGVDGYDIAVALSEPSTSDALMLSGAKPADAAEVDTNLRPGCSMRGGVSGIRHGFVFAPLNVVRDGARWWSNCWTVVGERGYFVKEGDSGAATTLHGSGKVLGHVVAGLGTEYRGRFELGVVQDLESQLAHLRNKFQLSLS